MVGREGGLSPVNNPPTIIIVYRLCQGNVSLVLSSSYFDLSSIEVYVSLASFPGLLREGEEKAWGRLHAHAHYQKKW